MVIGFFLKGFAIGACVSIPVGPIALLIIRRTLAQGRWAGFVSGLGSSTADGVYSSIAAFGLTFVSNAILAYQYPLRIVGGLFLAYLGIRTFMAPPPVIGRAATSGNRFNDYISMFFLTLTNPMTLFAFAAVFAAFGVDVAVQSFSSALFLVIGVMSGSATWWLALSGLVSIFRSKCTPAALQLINRISGTGIVLFGAIVFFNFVHL